MALSRQSPQRAELEGLLIMNSIQKPWRRRERVSGRKKENEALSFMYNVFYDGF